MIYGGDNSLILDSLRALRPEATRAIGGIPEGDVPEATLAQWHRLGLRALRVNYTSYKPCEGGAHVKIAAAYQISEAPGFADVAPVAWALYGAPPDRVIWGTDWPHIRHEEHGDAAILLDLFGAWFPEEAD